MEHGLPKNMYSKHILELYKSPKNYGLLENPTVEITETNSLCGDEITIQLIFKDKKIRDAKFSGSGCVLSLVSSSLITDKIKGMEVKDIKKMDKKDVLKLLGISVTPSRMKCVVLPLEAVKKALG